MSIVAGLFIQSLSDSQVHCGSIPGTPFSGTEHYSDLYTSLYTCVVPTFFLLFSFTFLFEDFYYSVKEYRKISVCCSSG